MRKRRKGKLVDQFEALLFEASRFTQLLEFSEGFCHLSKRQRRAEREGNLRVNVPAVEN